MVTTIRAYDESHEVALPHDDYEGRTITKKPRQFRVRQKVGPNEEVMAAVIETIAEQRKIAADSLRRGLLTPVKEHMKQLLNSADELEKLHGQVEVGRRKGAGLSDGDTVFTFEVNATKARHPVRPCDLMPLSRLYREAALRISLMIKLKEKETGD